MNLKLGKKNVEFILSEVEAGRISNVQLQKIALGMDDKVHGRFKQLLESAMEPSDKLKYIKPHSQKLA